MTSLYIHLAEARTNFQDRAAAHLDTEPGRKVIPLRKRS